MSDRNPILDLIDRPKKSPVDSRPRPNGPKPPVAKSALDYRPFPVDSLPTSVADFVAAGASVFGCDPSMLALPAIAVCGGAIGVTHAIRLRRTWKEYPIIWSAVVAESGTLKSPAFKAATAPVWVVQDEWQVGFVDEFRRWSKQDEETRGERPNPRTLATTDSTIERAAELLQKNPRGIVKLREELSAWFAGMTRYRNHGSDSTAWLELFQGGRLAIHRKTGQEKDILVSNAAVSISGTIQPRILRNCFSGENRESGMSARFLLCCPPHGRKQWRDIDVEPAVEDRYGETIQRLASLSFADANRKSPVVVPLSPDGQAAWIDFYDRFASVQHRAEDEQRARYAKLEAYCARLALIDHLARVVSEDRPRSSVEVDSVERAVRLTMWFVHESDRVHQILSESDDERDLRRLVEWIQRRGGQTAVKPLQQSNSRKYPDADSARESLNRLVLAGVARWEKRATKTAGRWVDVLVLHSVRPCDDSDDPILRDATTTSDDSATGFDSSFETTVLSGVAVESSDGRTPSAGGIPGPTPSTHPDARRSESSDAGVETEEEAERRLEREAIQSEPRWESSFGMEL